MNFKLYSCLNNPKGCIIAHITSERVIDRQEASNIRAKFSKHYDRIEGEFDTDKYRADTFNYIKTSHTDGVSPNLNIKDINTEKVSNFTILQVRQENREDENYKILEGQYHYLPNYAKLYEYLINLGMEAQDAFNMSATFELNKIRCSHIIVPEGVTEIPYRAFKGNKNIKKVIFPNSLKRINKEAFSYCPNLECINFSDSIEIIDAFAFTGCDSLKRINFGTGLEYIGREAFEYCRSLSSVPALLDVEVEEDAFNGCFNNSAAI